MGFFDALALGDLGADDGGRVFVADEDVDAPDVFAALGDFDFFEEVDALGGGAEFFGEEAVLAYLAAVETEITAVRMILTGKLAGIAPQTIRERLRDLYA